MQKLCVADAATHLGITKEAIYNRIRRGTLEFVEENGQKFIIIDSDDSKKTKKSSTKQIKKVPLNDIFTDYLLNQIDELKDENAKLHKQKDELYEQKEQILIQNKEEIKQIYKEKDDKLRCFLALLEKPLISKQNGEYLAPIDVEITEYNGSSTQNMSRNDDVGDEKKWIKFSTYCMINNLSLKDEKKLKKIILSKIDTSKRIKLKNGIVYIRRDKKIK
ncbi:MAG: DNA-binding protein [Campylobacter sputorum]|uniref:hypothetical protein n=1 Tax=Campylobacter sputorum TaxID=206 RepID=UPI000B78E36D|nr:hypothetical protein [Campylobacter sputorum]ASM37785.1 hypothetical protein CSPARA_0175 [Campylobacter sputorum bv. paraureolyticus LMG 11764]MDY6119917.1 DNA-binding protein [Campylobacter sputorum]